MKNGKHRGQKKQKRKGAYDKSGGIVSDTAAFAFRTKDILKIRIRPRLEPGSDYHYLVQREGFEPSCDCSQTDFESLEAGVFWSILSASLRLSERRKPLILLGFPAFLLSAQDFGNFPVKADFPEKCEHSVSVL